MGKKSKGKKGGKQTLTKFYKHTFRRLWIKQRKLDLSAVSSERAIARLRKFIAYKRRKHDLIHDAKYGVSDKARRAEGNWNFVMLAKHEVVAV